MTKKRERDRARMLQMIRARGVVSARSAIVKELNKRGDILFPKNNPSNSDVAQALARYYPELVGNSNEETILNFAQARFGNKLPRSDRAFFESRAWLDLRYLVLRTYGPVCMCCGGRKEVHVDHIKSRSRYPYLALCFLNAQVLCRACNLGKGSVDETDWRPLPLPECPMGKRCCQKLRGQKTSNT